MAAVNNNSVQPIYHEFMNSSDVVEEVLLDNSNFSSNDLIYGDGIILAADLFFGNKDEQESQTFIVKNLAIYNTLSEALQYWEFKPPCSWDLLSYNSKCSNNKLLEKVCNSSWYDGNVPYDELTKILLKCIENVSNIYTRGNVHVNFFTNLLGRNVINLESFINFGDIKYSNIFQRNSNLKCLSNYSMLTNCIQENVYIWGKLFKISTKIDENNFAFNVSYPPQQQQNANFNIGQHQQQEPPSNTKEEYNQLVQQYKISHENWKKSKPIPPQKPISKRQQHQQQQQQQQPPPPIQQNI